MAPSDFRSCCWCDRAIWLNAPSGEWFHTSTAERACTELLGSRLAEPKRLTPPNTETGEGDQLTTDLTFPPNRGDT